MSDDSKFKWWWRDLEKAKRTSKALRVSLNSPLHRRETLRAAWYYEAEKRLTGKYRFDKPFPRLAIEKIREAVYIWGHDSEERKATSIMWTSLEANKAPVETSNMYWPRVSLNLEASNESIFRALARHLAKVRVERGIKPSKRGRKAGENPHKNEPWKQIEAYDKSTNLDDCGRKRKSEMPERYLKKTRPSDLPEGLTRI